MRPLLFLLLVCVQDDVGRWIDELRSDDVAARDAAEEKLVKSGRAALAKLEPLLKTDDLDLRPRVERVTRAIRQNLLRDEVLSSGPRVTMDVKDLPFRQAMKELARTSGVEAWIDDAVEDRGVSLSVKDVSWLEALTRLCRTQGAARIESHEDHVDEPLCAWRREHPTKRARLRIAAGKSTNEPVDFAGPFRIAIAGMRLSRSAVRQESGFYVTISALWAPGLLVCGFENPIIDMYRDDHGRDLVAKGGVRAQGRGFESEGPTLNIYDALFDFSPNQAPAEDALSLARVEGRVPVWLCRRRAVARIDAPDKHIGEAIDFGDMTITIAKVKIVEDFVGLFWTVEWKKGVEWKRAASVIAKVRVLDDHGDDVPFNNGTSDTRIYKLPAGRHFAGVEASAPAELFRVEVPLAFKDVPLPRW